MVLEGPAYRIRTAITQDVGFLADVVVSATRAQGRWPEDLDEAGWRVGFCRWTGQEVSESNDDSETAVIELNGERVGRLRVVRTSTGIELAGIQLSPRVQRRGIGTAIIESLKVEAATAGVPLHLGVEKDNPDARRLYHRLGFVEHGEADGEYKLRWSS